MNDNEVEYFLNNKGDKFYLLKNSNLELSNKEIIKVSDSIKKIRNIYYCNNKIIHREDGPAIECENGTKEWYKNGLRHRDNFPAIEFANGDKYWYQNGNLHRENGPALEFKNGKKEYALNGFYVTESEYKNYLIEQEHKSFKLEINNNKKVKKIKV